MPFEPWMLAAIDRAGFNGIREEHIDAVAETILRSGITEVSRQDFDVACRRCGIDSDNFTQADFDRLQERLNRWEIHNAFIKIQILPSVAVRQAALAGCQSPGTADRRCVTGRPDDHRQ